MFIHNEYDCYISLYVDNIAIYSADTSHLANLINDQKKAFDISDLGEALFLLGLYLMYTTEGIALTQDLYIRTILSRFGK